MRRMAKQITEIHISSPGTHHHQITEVKLASGARKKREIVADEIDKGTESYYVSVDSTTVDVATEVVNTVKYIRTKPDATKKDNLLNLPRY